ncbi:energy-coupling factor ABC transporter ATP-binding protein [Bacillaceae bacterium Marseille-Q3522]|nr:energy-coupling factor ABC transporter ATP-binding protein [Bacillaceae bacterium Marseille-Q3522]
MDILLQEVEYRYQAGTPFEHLALQNVTLKIPQGIFLAIIGHTGSGKSTVLQHLNALLIPTKGKVTIGKKEISPGKKGKDLRIVRQKVGIVFQFPEHQLFEETVEKDICFGPINFGVPEKEAKMRAEKVIRQVGLDADILQKSPFDLSGGQMRRVAIAGVLAMEPDVIVLDEPTAGLDPRGRREIMEMFDVLHKERNLSTVLVTHSMEDAAHYADQIVVMHNGKIYREGKATEIFSSPEVLLELGLDIPEAIKFQRSFEAKTGQKLGKICLTVDELADEIAILLKRGFHYDG